MSLVKSDVSETKKGKERRVATFVRACEWQIADKSRQKQWEKSFLSGTDSVGK